MAHSPSSSEERGRRPWRQAGRRRGLETALKFKLVTFRGTSKFVKLGKNVQVKKKHLALCVSIHAGRRGSNDEKSITEIYVAHIISVRGTYYSIQDIQWPPRSVP